MYETRVNGRGPDFMPRPVNTALVPTCTDICIVKKHSFYCLVHKKYEKTSK